MEILKCLHCHHLWTPRSEEKPVVCPRCKNYSWDKPLTKKEKEAKQNDKTS